MESNEPQVGNSSPSERKGKKSILGSERTWLGICIGMLCIWAGVSLYGEVSWKERPSHKPKPRSVIVSQDMVPLVSGEEPLARLFTKAGCPVCHTIPGIQGAHGRVGPRLVLGTTGVQRLQDPRYQGIATTPREYIEESILHPRVYVVPGYPDQAMPAWYGKKLTSQALERMASYLLGIEEDSVLKEERKTKAR